MLRLRRENFEHVGPDTRDGRQLVPGRSWAAWSRALGLLLPPLEVADLGCGEGYLTVETARWARHVTAVDRSPAVLARAKALAARQQASNITWKNGELERLPIDDAPRGRRAALAGAASRGEPARALAEAARILKPGGAAADSRSARRTTRPGCARSSAIAGWASATISSTALLARAGFTDVRVALGARRTNDPFAVLLAVETQSIRLRALEISRATARWRA